MRVVQAAPARAIHSPVYIVGGYRFQVTAQRQLSSHEAIAYAAQWMQTHRTELHRDVVNPVVVDEHV
jgi:hypothetical protein